MVTRALAKMLRPIRNRITLMINRAVLTMIDDGPTLQQLQARLLGEELLDAVERFQQYGFTSVPHAGAEAIALSVGGHRSHTVIINVDDRRYRLKGLEGGEVALYSDEGDAVHLKRGRIVEIRAGALLRLITPLVECTGSVTGAGSITAGGDITAAGDILDQTGSGNARTVRGMREVYNAHTHTGDSGGTTDVPDQEQ